MTEPTEEEHTVSLCPTLDSKLLHGFLIVHVYKYTGYRE